MPDHPYGQSSYVARGDGRRLHLMSAGAGEPVVVLESGMGMSRSSWGLVAPAVAERTRAVVYDRAGLGRSDPDPAPRTLDRLVADLLAVVEHLAASRVVLVGHSWGGPIVRSAAVRLGPERVAGVVVVDQVDEHCSLYFEPSSARRFAMSSRPLPVLARLGLYRLLMSRPGRHQPGLVAAEHRREDFSVGAARGVQAEMATFLDELARLRDAPPDLTGIPLTVISGTLETRADRTVRTAIRAAHRRTAEVVPGARLVEAPRSGHLVNFSEPDVVVDAVRQLL